MELFPLIEGHYVFLSDFPIQTIFSIEPPHLRKYRHGFVEISCVAKGEGILYIDEEKLYVKKNDAFYIPPGITHVFQPGDLTGKRPLCIWKCFYKPELVKTSHEWEQHLWQDDYSFFSDLANQTKWIGFHQATIDCVAIIEKMDREKRSQNPLYRLKLMSQLLDLLTALFGGNIHSEFSKVLDSAYPIHAAIQYMVSHFNKSLSVNEVSHKVAMSPRNFQRKFKAATGRSFIKMLQDIRIDNSIWLLQFSNDSIHDIAHAVGMFDMKHYYRLFQERCGMTPATFRFRNESASKISDYRRLFCQK